MDLFLSNHTDIHNYSTVSLSGDLVVCSDNCAESESPLAGKGAIGRAMECCKRNVLAKSSEKQIPRFARDDKRGTLLMQSPIKPGKLKSNLFTGLKPGASAGIQQPRNRSRLLCAEPPGRDVRLSKNNPAEGKRHQSLAPRSIDYTTDFTGIGRRTQRLVIRRSR